MCLSMGDLKINRSMHGAVRSVNIKGGLPKVPSNEFRARIQYSGLESFSSTDGALNTSATQV